MSIDYLTYWQAFDKDEWRSEIVRGRSKRARVDIFLQYYLALKTEDDVLVTHLYKAFQAYLRKDKGLTAEDHLKSLREYASIFESFETHPEGSIEHRFFSGINIMEVTTAYPFLLEFYRLHGGSRKMVTAVLDDLQSFLVRRMVCQLTAKNYNNLFTGLVTALRHEGGDPDAIVRRYLLGSTADTFRWPDDQEFNSAWTHVPVYNALVRRRLALILRRLELNLRGPKTEDVHLPSNLQVEHLMPQQWQQHWPLKRGSDAMEAQKARNSLIHTIGNLTLVTKSLNPALSNGPWEQKRRQIQEHSVLLLNKGLPETWSESAISARTQSLFKHACKIWPHPGG